MARAYTVATAALALEADAKWVDNILSHHDVRGIKRIQRGVRRALPPESILILAVARSLCDDLGLSAARALALAEEAVAAPGVEQRLSRTLAVSIDVGTIAAELKERLDRAAEIAAVPRRGRRPHRRPETID